jgi:serine/threonine protein kinase
MGAVSSPPTDSPAELPPDRLVAGRYRLRRRLGQGSMGTVWEAYDEFLRRPVAVKEVLLPPGIPDAEADELRERTLREARAIAALSHPNVITLHDVARENREPFVVTEYMAAHSLAELLRALGPLRPTASAAIADAVAAGLAAAHQVGITHRDVKPGNVLVGTTPATNGTVKLTDFGIARNVSERTMTRTGIMLGSPAYIAPEVAAGREVTPAADLWGLGATLYAMLEGNPPYDLDGTVLEIVNLVVHGEVPRPSSEGPLAEIVQALLVKEPADRMSLAEARNRLRPLLPPPGSPLLTGEDLAALSDPDQQPTKLTPKPKPTAPPLPPPPAAPDVPQLAPAPGPLPFDATARRPLPRRRRRGRVASALLLVIAAVLFFAAAGGGFALARVVGGEPLLPPARTAGTTPSVPPETGAPDLVTQKGDAATVNGVQGGGYSIVVPRGWVRFVEERATGDLRSTRIYYVSADGRQLLTVERFDDYLPDRTIDDYVDSLADDENQTYALANRTQTRPLAGGEQGEQLTYRTKTNAANLAPGAGDLNRVTFANVLSLGRDLWVVAVTVPVDQEDTGREQLFARIAKTFRVTG